MDFKLLLIIFIVIVFLDKGLTAWNITEVNKHFPQVEPYSIEKNPVAKMFFEKYGLLNGSILFGIISVISLFLVFFVLDWIFNERIALWIIFIFYGAVLMNNTYFLLKYSQVIA